MILMYHHIVPTHSVPKNPSSNEGWIFSHTPQALEYHINKLSKKGFHFIQFEDLIQEIKKTGKEPPNSIVLTFDDGWADNYHFAFPILKRLGIPAIFFVTTNHLHSDITDPKKINANQLKEMLSAGMDIGAHTRTHPNLCSIPINQIQEEIIGSKQDLEQVLGGPVKYFAYPGGQLNLDLARMLKKTGFEAACSAVGPARNTRKSLYWLYRNILSEKINTFRDQIFLSSIGKSMLGWRTKSKLKNFLSNSSHFLILIYLGLCKQINLMCMEFNILA